MDPSYGVLTTGSSKSAVEMIWEDSSIMEFTWPNLPFLPDRKELNSPANKGAKFTP